MKLLELLEKIKEIALDLVDECYIDSVRILNDRQCKYKNVVIDIESSEILDNGMVRHNLVLYYTDKMLNKEYPYKIYQDAQEKLMKLLKKTDNIDGVLEIDYPTIEYFQQDFNDVLAGGFVRVGIRVNSGIDGC